MSEQGTQLAMPHLAARLFDTPLLIAQSKLDVILQALGPRMGFDIESAEDAEQSSAEQMNVERYEARLASLAPAGVRIERRDQGHYVAGDVAIVPVIGSLVHRSSWLDAWSGLVSYARIESMMAAALSDYSVREILVEVDSPGGEATGAFDSADRLAAMRGSKKITAVAAEFAASGGFLMASTADEIVVPRTGAVGSIGVVSAHFDYSKAIEKRGVAVTYIYAGDRKIDGSPYLPLSAEAKSDFQEKIDALYELFVATVAHNLKITADQVRATQAGIYMGTKAIDAKLAHRVGSFEQELAAAVSRQAGPFRLDAQGKEIVMSEQKKDGGSATITAEDVSKARAEGRAEGHAAGLEEGTKAGGVAAVKSERERIKAIVTHADATGRAELAAHLAFETDMPADKATELLGKSPKAEADSPLARAMAAEGKSAIANQPGKDPAPAPAINVLDIHKQRREQDGARRR